MSAEPTFAELIAVLDSNVSNESIRITNKRRAALLQALRIADAGLADAAHALLNYTGGWDLPLHGDHPISKMRAALERADLLTSHPPCQHIAPVERFDLASPGMTFSARHLLGQLRNGPIEGDNFEGHAALEILKGFGLVEVRRPGGRSTIVVTLTQKGKDAK